MSFVYSFGNLKIYILLHYIMCHYSGQGGGCVMRVRWDGGRVVVVVVVVVVVGGA